MPLKRSKVNWLALRRPAWEALHLLKNTEDSVFVGLDLAISTQGVFTGSVLRVLIRPRFVLTA